MTGTNWLPPDRHPLTDAAAGVRESLDAGFDTETLFADPDVKAHALCELTKQSQRLQTLIGHLTEESEDVAAVRGARNASAWLANETNQDVGAVRAQTKLAKRAGERWHLVDEALAAGAVTVLQARVIVRRLDELENTGTVSGHVLDMAEERLVSDAGVHTPKALKQIAARIVTLVADELDDEADRKALERAEREARKKTILSIRDHADGTSRISGVVPQRVGHQLQRLLEAYTKPRAHQPDEADFTDQADAIRQASDWEKLSFEERLGHGLCALLDRISQNEVPQQAGAATEVMVFTTLAELQNMVGAATTDTGDVMSPSELMRTACNAKLAPVVLNGVGEVLHLGRARRLFDKYQVKAKRATTHECEAIGCTVPATWCEAHHRNGRWVDGGKTDIEDMALLCPFHHHRAHDPAYIATETFAGFTFRLIQ